MEKDRLKDLKDKFSESYGTLNTMYAKMLESHYMYANQQWTEADSRNSKKKNINPTVYNFMKKNVDVLIGIQRQNRPALKVLPEERDDNITAGIASILLHHAMRKGNGYMAVSQAMKPQIIGGLGWLSPYIDFSKDSISGDLRVVADSPFDLWFDPGLKEMDLSDCSYIIKRKAVHKNMAKMCYPDFMKEIENSKADYKSDYYVLEESGLKDKCVVKELWERVIEPHVTMAVNGQVMTMHKNQYEQNLPDIEMAKMTTDFTEMHHAKPVMKLLITVNDIIVYDGPSIYKGDFYPFIPVWGFYDKSVDAWSMKLSGLLESIKDPQREYNKTRASITHHMLTSIHSGWQMDKNAVDDIRVLRQGMSAPIIQMNPGKNLQRIAPPPMPDVMINYANEAQANMMKIGLNAEALGYDSGVESIKGMKMKTMQGMATVGELIDNFNYGFTNLGKVALSMIYQFYTLDKIKSILGSEYDFMTKEHMLNLQTMDHNIEVDDTTYSPVQKMYRLESKMQLAQYGIEGFEAEDFFDDLDIDPADRLKLAQRIQEKKAQKEAMDAQNAQSQAMLAQAKAGTEQAKASNMNVQSQLMGASTLEKMAGLGVRPGDITAQHNAEIVQAGANNNIEGQI